MMPTSAMSRISSRIVFSSPASPFWAMRGAWFIDDLKWTLPHPPFPPAATTISSPASSRSASSFSLPSSFYRCNYRPRGHRQDKVSAILAEHFPSRSVMAVLRAVQFFLPRKARKLSVDLSALIYYVATLPTIATVRAAVRHIHFPSESSPPRCPHRPLLPLSRLYLSYKRSQYIYNN